MLKGILNKQGRELEWEEYLVSNDQTLLPLPLRNAIFKQFNVERSRWMSPSSLMYCLRKAKWEFERDYYIREKNAFILLRGSLIHKILEDSVKEGPGILSEKEIQYKLPDIDFTLSGRIDLWDNGTLYDYKTLSEKSIGYILKDGVKKEHIWQTNIYKLMLSKSLGLRTDRIKIIYITMSDVLQSGSDFITRDVRNSTDKVHIIPACPIISEDKVEEMISSKVKLIIEGYNPPASPQDWMCGACYFRKECQDSISGNKQSEIINNKDLF